MNSSDIITHLASNQPQPSVSAEFEVDENILAQFPQGTKLLEASLFGSSAWTLTAQIRLQRLDGQQERYFVKSATTNHGRTMMEGEFKAMSEIYKWAPRLVPRPYFWGQYSRAQVDTYFFVSEFLDMAEGMPDPEYLCSNLAKLHQESQSPGMKFGFHTTTCQGRIAQSVDWEENWTVFFTKLLRHVIDLDVEVNGDWEALKEVASRLMSHVIPRLLDALPRVKPSLIHSDLWEGNSGTKDGKVYIFDAACFYAHNEMEIGNWRCYYNKISNDIYTKTYLRYFPESEPKSEWGDRNQLYSIYYNIIYSVNHMDSGTAVRQLAFRDMYDLIDRFAPFPEGTGPGRMQESEMTSLPAERNHTLS